MKKFILFILIFTSLAALKAQQTCVTAVNIIPAATCNYTTHTTSGTEYWLKFVASSPTVNISLVTVKFGINATHIHNLALFTGVCGNLTLLADDELPFVADAKELAIDLNASGLVIGQTYYIRATRPATLTSCDKASCTANGSTNPTTFDICVENIDVFIPLDFGVELPSLSHSYITNRGQLVDMNGNLRPEIKLYTINANPNVFIADDKISYVFTEKDTNTVDTGKIHRVDMTLVGGNTTRIFKTEQRPEVINYYLAHIPLGVTKNNSFSRAVCNEVYSKIDLQYYSNELGVKHYFIVKPGGDDNDIVMKFDGATSINITANGGLEIFTSIGKLRFEPPHAYQINNGGNIVPMPWQAKFEAIPNTINQYKFKIHNYSHTMPLIIQVDKGHILPQQQQAIDNLDWSTYLGGSSADDVGIDIQVDGIDNVYVTGFAGSANFPATTVSPIQSSFGGFRDAFVSKFNSSAQLLWTTYFGGTDEETGLSLLPSQDGLVYFTGFTFSSNFPTANNTATSPYNQTFLGGERDAFIVSLNPVGSGSLVWSSYFGGFTNDVFHKITEDGLGNLILGGSVRINQQLPPNTTIFAGIPACDITTNQGFPVCDNPPSYFKNSHSGGNFDPILVKFDNDRKLSWSTFFGGSGSDAAWDLIVDPSDNSFYVTGFTQTLTSGDNPCNVPTNNGFPLCDLGGSAYFQNTPPGSSVSSYVSKFDSQNRLVWSTFFGQSSDQVRIHHLALNSIGDLYIVGRAETSSNIDLPDVFCDVPTNGGFPLCDAGSGAYFVDNDNVDVQSEAFITKFNSAKQITWSTFFGGADDETNDIIGLIEDGTINIAIDNSDRVFILRNSKKISGTGGDLFIQPHPATSPTFYNQTQNAGSGATKDAFLATFDSSNHLIWSTYFGGAGTTFNATDLGHGLAIDNNNNSLYITGGTVSTTFPTTCPSTPNPYCISTLNTATWFDAYISRFNLPFQPVGINDNNFDNDGLVLFPNPTTGNVLLTLELTTNTDVNVLIYNALGQVLKIDGYKNQKGVLTHNVELNNFTKGIYFINVSTNNKTISRKVIKN